MSTPKYAIVEKSSLDIKTDIFQGISFSSQYSPAGELLLDHYTIAFNGLVSQISLIPFLTHHIFISLRECVFFIQFYIMGKINSLCFKLAIWEFYRFLLSSFTVQSCTQLLAVCLSLYQSSSSKISFIVSPPLSFLQTNKQKKVLAW